MKQNKTEALTTVALLASLFGNAGVAQVISSKPERSLTASDAVFCLAFSPDGGALATGDYGKSVRMWRPDGTLMWGGQGHSKEVRSVAFSPDGIVLASGGADGTIRLWRTADGAALHSIVASKNSVLGVRGLAFSPDGRLLAAVTDVSMGIYDPTTGRLTRSLALDGKGKHIAFGGTTVAFGPDGRMLAAAAGVGNQVVNPRFECASCTLRVDLAGD